MFLLLVVSLAFAGDDVERDDEGRKVTYKTKTEIDFEGLEVEGVLQKLNQH